ncbi:DUF3618 domain-containing protein [Actinomadura livida]|uniref:DUF3618 domain-containing protein n=1 Tax=Actinomadura livida TaxID=79909 RepID=A0A7W7MXZ3_9ACTN|nr:MULTISPECIES: DUF3618 domain-containing protein [Actinomadura]MBB4775268.1 hypothetical protein [Actinomadura catellatispora]GGT89089.1 hypothetical protein GCM10010208_09820 [Actinomadura livida]
MTTQGKHGAEAGTEELRQEVDRARHDLGETVEQLAAKADVKAMARQKATEAKARMRETAATARARRREATARAKDAGGGESAKRGGVVIASAGAVALAAVLVHRRRAARSRLSYKVKHGAASKLRTGSKLGGGSKPVLKRLGSGRSGMFGSGMFGSVSMPGRGRRAPVRVVFRSAQKEPVKVKRSRMPL